MKRFKQPLCNQFKFQSIWACLRILLLTFLTSYLGKLVFNFLKQGSAVLEKVYNTTYYATYPPATMYFHPFLGDLTTIHICPQVTPKTPTTGQPMVLLQHSATQIFEFIGLTTLMWSSQQESEVKICYTCQ